ncbi:hypothetical protein K474DRAFT_1667627 [Panus rudis PR-1116 ss-1]|nr:hypothetical protein K474DRAFT_1667627 [Panus rudis PR-1116 ss-1]
MTDDFMAEIFTLTIPQLRGRRPLLGLFALSELAGSFLPVLYGVALYSEDKRLVAVVGAGPVCMLSDPEIVRLMKPCPRVEGWVKKGVLKPPQVYVLLPT